MNVYSITIQIAATAYIKADNEAEALAKANALNLRALELPTGYLGEVAISGLRFDNPHLPEVSLSPAMTMHGAWSGDLTEVELVHESGG